MTTTATRLLIASVTTSALVLGVPAVADAAPKKHHSKVKVVKAKMKKPKRVKAQVFLSRIAETPAPPTPPAPAPVEEPKKCVPHAEYLTWVDENGRTITVVIDYFCVREVFEGIR